MMRGKPENQNRHPELVAVYPQEMLKQVQGVRKRRKTPQQARHNSKKKQETHFLKSRSLK